MRLTLIVLSSKIGSTGKSKQVIILTIFSKKNVHTIKSCQKFLTKKQKLNAPFRSMKKIFRNKNTLSVVPRFFNAKFYESYFQRAFFLGVRKCVERTHCY